MRRKNVTMHNHAENRMKLPERLSPTVTKEQIISAIRNGNFFFARKVTNTRSIIYGETSCNESFKAVYSRKEDMIVTILPMYYLYQTDWFYIFTTGKIYRIKIYPDCYLETNNPRIMTKFEILWKIENKFVETTKQNDTFLHFFKLIWGEYETKVTAKKVIHPLYAKRTIR